MIVGLLCLIVGLASGDNVTLNKNAVRKSDLQIFIDTGTITNQVVLKKPDGSVEGKCLAPLSGKSGNCSANFAQSGTRTTVTLSSVSRANHQGVWTSEHGRDKGNINITVLTVPASITEQSPAVTDFELTTCTSKTLTVVVECAYPSVQIDWEFVTDVPSSTGICKTCTDMGLTGGACSDAAAKTFHCDFTVTETSTASLSAGKYKLKANLYMDGEVTSTGISVELSTIITIPASSSICDSCRTINALAVIGLFVAVGCVVLYWIVYFQLSGRLQGPCSVFTKSKSGGGNGELECSVTWCFRATIIATVVSVIGLILCIAGLIICVTCDDSVSSSNSVTVGFNLALVGFVLAAVTLVIAIIDVIHFLL